MDFEVTALAVVAGAALFAALGGSVSHLKNRRPLEGFLLGGLLGPFGVVLVLRQPFGHRPMVDPSAWDSFRTLVDHQSASSIRVLQLPSPTTSTAKRR